MDKIYENQERIASQWNQALEKLRRDRVEAKKRGDKGLMTSLASQIKKYEDALFRLGRAGLQE